MWIVQVALRRPYTFVVLALLIALFGVRAALLTPTDIFPNINIPVISVVWTYTGLPPNDMSGRIIYYYERTHYRSGRRHRAHRVAVARRLRCRQDLLSEGRQYLHRDGAGDRRLANGAEVSAGRHHPAVRAQLQRLERSHPAARALEQIAAADAAVRLRPELHSRRSWPPSPEPRSPPPTAARCAMSRSIWTSSHAGARCLGGRRGQCGVGAEPDPAGGR